MGKVFVHVERVGNVGDRGDFKATVGGDRFEDIEVTMLGDRKLIAAEPHEIVAEIAARDGEVADVVLAALDAGEEVLVNGRAMDPDAARGMLAAPVAP